jgi:hypothetical protein
MIRSALIVVVSAVLIACGPPRTPTVDHVQLVMPPQPVDIESTAGPDGVQARVFLYQGPNAQTVLGDGRLDILLFDGRLNQAGPKTDPVPLKVWSYTPEQLQRFQSQTIGLWNYNLMLLWGDARPTQNIVTVIARYTAPSGQQVFSSPVQVPIR